MLTRQSEDSHPIEYVQREKSFGKRGEVYADHDSEKDIQVHSRSDSISDYLHCASIEVTIGSEIFALMKT